MSVVIPFSQALRERTWSSHGDSEGADFMSDLMSGRGTRDDYIALVAQHFFIYEALEAAAETMADNEIAAPFISPHLTRLPAIEADLEFLLGPEWREAVSPLPTTQRYVDRINGVAAVWPGGFIAHHYTRYLGDLSGGQAIGRALDRTYDLGGAGTAFYDFAGVAKPKPYKDAYRARLDALGTSPDDKGRIVEEVKVAFGLNQALFNELGQEIDAFRRVT
jgi:heme oxygenase